MGIPIHVCTTIPSNWQKAVQYAKRNAGYDQVTLSGVSMNLVINLICP